MTTLGSIDWGLIGIWLLVVAALALVMEGALGVILAVRLSRRGNALNEWLTTEQADVRASVEGLKQSLAEMAVLWQPYRRLWRFLRHPLMLALLRSYARRRAPAR